MGSAAFSSLCRYNTLCGSSMRYESFMKQNESDYIKCVKIDCKKSKSAYKAKNRN